MTPGRPARSAIPCVGVLAVQGAFERHAEVLGTIGIRARLVRAPADFEGLRGLVLPGGESSVQLAMIERLGLEAPLRALLVSGNPVLATCAGLVLVSAHVALPEQRSLRAIDVDVTRNAWGRQQDSFEGISDEGRPLVFIRAPRITRVGVSVRVLDRFRGEPVLVECANVTCATYHPELTDDTRLHQRVFVSARDASVFVRRDTDVRGHEAAPRP